MPRTTKRSFGPVVFQAKDGGPLVARCYGSGVDCTFRIGNVCTHQEPTRPIETLPETPDWCEMKSDALRDAAEMAAH